MQLTPRQIRIVEIVKSQGPITGEEIAKKLALTRATLRPDLAILTMSGILEARPRVGYYYCGKSSQDLVANELKKIFVKDIKSIPIIVREEVSVYDAIVTLFMQDVGSLFVANKDSILLGIVSRKDLLRQAMGQGDLHSIPVKIIMTKMPNIITVEDEDSVYDAAKKIIDCEVDTLPVVKKVVDEDGKEQYKILGRFTKTNITRLFVKIIEGI